MEQHLIPKFQSRWKLAPDAINCSRIAFREESHVNILFPSIELSETLLTYSVEEAEKNFEFHLPSAIRYFIIAEENSTKW